MTTADGKFLLLICAPKPPAGAPPLMFETPVEAVNIHDFDEQEQAARADEVDAVIGLDNQVGLVPDLHQFTNLKALLDFSVGFGNFSPEMIPDGCAFANTYGHEQSVADWAIMAMLMLSRDALRRERAFRTQTIGTMLEMGGIKRDIRGSTVGVVGLGHIGKSIVENCTKFDMRVLVAMRTPISNLEATSLGIDKVFPLEELNKMLPECDYVVPAIPSNAQTEGMFSKSELELMKDSAFFINIARAELLDEKSAFNALKEGTIAGAALDVWWKESPATLASDNPEDKKWSTYPFWELDNVIMSPHWSSATSAMMDLKFDALVKQVDRLNRGEPLINIVPELSKS